MSFSEYHLLPPLAPLLLHLPLLSLSSPKAPVLEHTLGRRAGWADVRDVARTVAGHDGRAAAPGGGGLPGLRPGEEANLRSAEQGESLGISPDAPLRSSRFPPSAFPSPVSFVDVLVESE